MEINRVELLNIHKSFGGIYALQDVTVKAKVGEIHALVGENGAGKSTLMKILSGSYQMDEGEIRINGQKVTINDPAGGRKAGIGIIYQEFSLIPDLSVAENIYLHYLKQKKFFMPWTEIEEKAGQLIHDLGFDISPRKKVRELNASGQQIVEIAKALCEKVEILILDEPTAVLAPKEAVKLFDVLNTLKEKGVTVLYISHRLEEIFQIADKATILKDGTVIKTAQINELDQDKMISLMIGRKMKTLFPERNTKPGKELLKVKNLAAGKSVKDVSFVLREGEVLGIAGLVGSGRTETLRALFASYRFEKGEIILEGEKHNFKSPRDAVRSGLGLVPEDRKAQGVLLELSIRKNLTLTSLKTVSSWSGFIKEKKEKEISRDLITSLGIRADRIEEKVNNLSGGNQQKVVLSKWLGRNCKVLLMDEPTRGIDVGAKAEIYQLINDLSEKGVGIVVVSSEIMELMGLCDRILVMRQGRINGMLQKKEFSEEAIMKLSIVKNKTDESNINQ